MNNAHQFRTAFALAVLLSAFSSLANASLNTTLQVLESTRNDHASNGALFSAIRNREEEFAIIGTMSNRLKITSQSDDSNSLAYFSPGKSYSVPINPDSTLAVMPTAPLTFPSWARVETKLIQYDPSQQEIQRQLDEAKRLAEEAKKHEEELKRLAEEAKSREETISNREQESQQRLKEAQDLAAESQNRLDAIKQAQLEADPAYREEREREEREAEEANQRAIERDKAEKKAIQAFIERTFTSPPEGNYICSYTKYDVDEGTTVESKGFFSLNSDSTYRWLGSGPGGLYRYNSAKKQVKFLSGPLAYPGLVAVFDNKGVRGINTKPIIIFTFQTPATLDGKAAPIKWLCEWKKFE